MWAGNEALVNGVPG